MLLSEQERQLSSEQSLFSSSTMYNVGTLGSWVLINDYGYKNVPATGIVFFQFKMSTPASGVSWFYGALYVGGMPVEVYSIGVGQNVTVGGAVWLTAGSYDFQLQGEVNGTMSGSSIGALQVGFTLFNDCATYALQATTQGGTINLTVPSRNTPLGNLNEAVFCINVSAQAPSNQLVSMEPITVDGVSYNGDEIGPTAIASSQKLYIPLSVGTQHSISCTTGNSEATMYVSIIACPWILTTYAHFHQPVTLNITQLSTIYAVICPLFNDVLKECFVGAPKGISSGAASDFYGYASAGTGSNVSFSYTFDSVNANIVSFSADSLGGCIDNIGVDVE
jgi:hypothetical protein